MRRRTELLTVDDFELVDAELPQLTDGYVLARTSKLSLDPYLTQSMKTWLGETPGWVDGTIHGRVLAQVVDSRTDALKAGDLITGLGRWQECQVFNAESVRPVPTDITPPSLVLGALGASGWTAWIGLHLADLQPGHTVFVSAATGTVGSIAGQLAIHRGCRVIGMAGGAQKRTHAVDVLGFDACVDHRETDLAGQIADVAGDGIDVVFENVGAPSIDAALPSMVQHGRIMMCGLAAHYNTSLPATLHNFLTLLYKQISIIPFTVSEHRRLLPEARRAIHEGIATESIRFDEAIIDGFENAPRAFLDMLAGAGLGKRLIRIDH
ncbi:MDR family NADP-dependent oxidoreductase [Mycolicibacterium arenosum]|uniref:NADP-dependent oxidoreductase n=1 Tax=Mycolicibacterium arenosum TaxID=2952157 RepID=A0ABT1MEI3_9MYCO|nr:NADP-dependent oxidoreductase [Mycolicibacterium sp. CAU 1645]MCP9276812.1 NADP-dependent oxidoreductase [Mycolicibacterium sp. CAU 1645]